MCRISPRFDLASGAKSNLGKIRGSRQARGRIAEKCEALRRARGRISGKCEASRLVRGRILGKCGIVIMK